jgi:hypothetical protein
MGDARVMMMGWRKTDAPKPGKIIVRSPRNVLRLLDLATYLGGGEPLAALVA